MRLVLLVVLGLAAAVRPGAAQVLGDTLATDSLLADTVDQTARYLRALEQEEVRVPVLPQLTAPGPRPALTRLVFTRDSIEWMSGATVGDLLAQVPGVYLWRGGYTGRPEPVNFQGRGGTSAEYFLDGVPYVAEGVDSIGVDPALFSVSFLDRVEVERWPGLLRVHLFTRRQDRLAPRSRVAIARGDRRLRPVRGRSRASISLRTRLRHSPPTTSTPRRRAAPSSSYSNTQAWVQGSYIPSNRFGTPVPAHPVAPQAAGLHHR